MKKKTKSFKDIFKEEGKKLRDYERWTFNGFVYPHEINEVRKRLRDSGLKFRTDKIQRNKKLAGYRVYILEE